MNDEPIVTISTGKIRGQVFENQDQGLFYSFKGIPYGKPPLGELRFKAPRPAEPWFGVRDGTEEGPECFAKTVGLDVLAGEEDCLYLNVYTKDIKPSTRVKPVMVFIHGGGFTSGSGSSDLYGPQFLLTEDIVLVTFNYRLHILGFLSFDDPNLEVPGNAGMKDMVLALEWVQQNIAHFNGDPGNVTIFGESAGGASVHYLILSPLAKGLFHKAILQSGCALNIWAHGTACAAQLGQILGLGTTNEAEILRHLQQLSKEELYEVGEQIPDQFIASMSRPFGPVIEQALPGAFLTQHPLEILKAGNYTRVPMIFGYNNREGMFSEVLQKPKPFKPLTDFELAVPHILGVKPKSDVSRLMALKIQEFYYGAEEPSDRNKDNFYLLESDNFFIREILRSVRYHLETTSSPIYLYKMSVETSLNMMKGFFYLTEPGVCHADDIGYLFKTILTPDMTQTSDEYIAMKRFVKLWTSFARTGNPNPVPSGPFIGTTWVPVSLENLEFLEIGRELTIGTHPEHERLAFWEGIFQIKATNKL